MTSIGFLLLVYNFYFFVYFYLVFSCIVLPFWRNKVYILRESDTLSVDWSNRCAVSMTESALNGLFWYLHQLLTHTSNAHGQPSVNNLTPTRQLFLTKMMTTILFALNNNKGLFGLLQVATYNNAYLLQCYRIK